MTAVILFGSGLLFIIGYFLYGGYIARKLGIDRKRPTPAHTLRDGVDYEPARRSIVLGHHFASIAGAAPIIGPVTAAVFGWLPVLLWIAMGGLFMGAVHDFSSLVASVRHQGKSIGSIIEVELGPKGKTLFLFISWAALTLVVAVFGSVVAKTFVNVPQCATASVLFLFIAVGWGYLPKKNIFWSTLLGIVLMAMAIFTGSLYPLELSYHNWLVLLFGYIFVASVTPVWVLLQPRDYLNSWLLYAMIALAIISVLVASPDIQSPAFVSLVDHDLGPIFPILFVTVACGAISGFHSLVASGTVSKQLDSEADARTVGFGGMLLESFLAVIALIAAVTFSPEKYSILIEEGGPVAIFSNGLGTMAAELGIPIQSAITFLALAVSAFAMTTLDTATRLGRFAVQEFFSKPGSSSSMCQNRYLATIITILPAMLLTFSGSWSAIWPIFGSANQLLAALALLAISAWMINRGKKPYFTLIPMFFMMAVALSALSVFIFNGVTGTGDIDLAVIAAVLFAVALYLLIYARRQIRASAGEFSGPA